MNHTTLRFPRRAGENRPCDAHAAIALHTYKAPLTRRFFYARLKWGWVAVLVTVFLLAGCDDLEMHAEAQADLADAIAQAAKEAAQ